MINDKGNFGFSDEGQFWILTIRAILDFGF